MTTYFGSIIFNSDIIIVVASDTPLTPTRQHLPFVYFTLQDRMVGVFLRWVSCWDYVRFFPTHVTASIPDIFCLTPKDLREQ